MAVQDWSTNPDSNGTIEGTNIAENCPASNVNDVIRKMAAAIRVLYNNLPNVSALMPKSGGAFTGQITRDGRGGYLHHANSAQGGGAVHILASGTALPSSPAEGTVVFFY